MKEPACNRRVQDLDAILAVGETAGKIVCEIARNADEALKHHPHRYRECVAFSVPIKEHRVGLAALQMLVMFYGTFPMVKLDDSPFAEQGFILRGVCLRKGRTLPQTKGVKP